MIDIVMPDGNEKAFVEMADRLGYKELCFLYKTEKELNEKLEKGVKPTKVKVYCGILQSQPKFSKADLIIVDNNERKSFESKQGDVIIHLEKQDKDFIHHRSSGLNQVLAKLAKDNKKIICVDFSMILNSSGVERAQIIGRVMQNIKFSRKFKFGLGIASFAKKPEDMRSPHDLKAFLISLGMHPKEASDSLVSVSDKIKDKLKRKSSSYIAEGIELVE